MTWIKEHSRLAEMVFPTPLDIYRTANLLLIQHWADAPILAEQRADGMLDNGDIEGAAVWRRIVDVDRDDVNERTAQTSQRFGVG